MDAIVLLFTKFPDEMLSIQLALISFFAAFALYFFLVRRHKRYKDEWVPAAIVREHLDKIDYEERMMRMRLFGEESVASTAPAAVNTVAGAAPTVQTVVVSNDPAIQKELAAVRAQLAAADQRSSEFDRMKATWDAEKLSLEKQIKDAKASAGTATGGGEDPQLAKELNELKARLSEYEVIEDDLANLKKYQIENKSLKERLAQLEKGGAAPATEAPAATPAPVAAVAPAPAPVAEAAPAPAATAPAAAPEAAAAPAANKEQDLLSEFEKMLAS